MALPDFLPGRFALARGRPSDYFALEHFHYLPQRPATYADVWVVRYEDDHDHDGALALREAPPLAAGVLCSGETNPPKTNPPKPNPPRAAALHGAPDAALHFADHDPREGRWRNAQRHDDDRDGAWRVVAAGVLSFPGFRSLPRERVLNLLDRSHRDRLRFTNAQLRTISRIVVHPQFRGLGLASALVRQLIAVCPTRYVEASAVMARVHPFFEAAGMRNVQCDESKPDDAARPAYFIFDKEEGSSCEAAAPR